MRALLKSLFAERTTKAGAVLADDSEPPASAVPAYDPEAAFWFPQHAGLGYLQVLERLHRGLRPRTYLEIGTATGTSLAFADCASLAVDPGFTLDQEVIGAKPRCLFFQEDSDGFFAREDLAALLGRPVDLAFLDGMHEFEFLLRDFMGAERAATADSVIVMHDCLPTDSHVARRDPADLRHEALAPHPGWWAGDVWKAVAILQASRPDLTIRAVDAPPTGLIVVTDLDPASTVLRDGYLAAVEAWANVELNQAEAERLRAGLTPLPSAVLRGDTGLAQAFPRAAGWRQPRAGMTEVS